jgi:hypothetical protein
MHSFLLVELQLCRFAYYVASDDMSNYSALRCSSSHLDALPGLYHQVFFTIVVACSALLGLLGIV